jgi:hypothetical protein
LGQFERSGLLLSNSFGSQLTGFSAIKVCHPLNGIIHGQQLAPIKPLHPAVYSLRGGYANPTMTSIALTFRLAEHLKNLRANTPQTLSSVHAGLTGSEFHHRRHIRETPNIKRDDIARKRV